ncbi:MAG: NYN domain-containing protein [Verrucomicrobiales bacterium]
MDRSATDRVRGRFLLVDGHSMIFAWDELRELHERRMVLAREALCQRLQTYQDMTDERVVVVFDGNQGEKPKSPDQATIQVLYSKKGGSADQILERLACKYAGEHDLTVASRDRAVLDMVSSFGAHAISANGLADRLEAAEQRFRGKMGDYLR